MAEDNWTEVHYRRGRMFPRRRINLPDIPSNRNGRFYNDVATPQGRANRYSNWSRDNENYQRGRFSNDAANQRVSANRFEFRSNDRISTKYDYNRYRQNNNDVAYRFDSADRYRSTIPDYSRANYEQYRPTFAQVANRPRPKQVQQRDKIPPLQRPRRTREFYGRSYNHAPRMAASQQLRTMAKHMHKLIRLIHHLQNVASEDGLPVTFQRLEDYLSDIIKPAYPDDKLQLLLNGNARHWVHTTQMILRDHYELSIKQVLDELVPVMAEDWHLAFEIAQRWARRSLGRRLTHDTMTQAEALITAECPTTLNKENNTKKQMVETEIQTSPRDCEKGVVDTEIQTSPPSRGDWSFLDDDFPPLPPPMGSSPFPQEKAVQDQRDVRRRVRIHHNPCVQTRVDMEIVPCPPSQDRTHLGKPTDQSIQHQDGASTNHPGDNLAPVTVDLVSFNEDLIQEQTTQNMTPPQNDTNTNLDTSPILTPIPVVRGSVQSMLNLTPTTTCKPIRHINTNRKMLDWSLSVRKKWLIIGDSNLSRIPTYHIPDLQVDSFPGATFLHAETLLNKASINTKVEKVVLAFGMNHRDQKVKETAIKQLQRAVKAAKDRFPYAEIWIPLINFCRSLPLHQQEALELLNRYIQAHVGFIPLLPNTQFTVERGKNIHWTTGTAKAMLQHWKTHLNFIAP